MRSSFAKAALSGPAQPARRAFVFGLWFCLGDFHSLRRPCVAKSSLSAPRATSDLITSLGRRPGPKCRHRAAVPWPVLSPHPALPLPTQTRHPAVPPPGAATLTHRLSLPLRLLGQLSLPSVLSSDFGAENLSHPLPVLTSAMSSLNSPALPQAHVTAHRACLWGHLSSLPGHTLCGAEASASFLPVGRQFPAQCPDVMGGQRIFVEKMRL